MVIPDYEQAVYDSITDCFRIFKVFHSDIYTTLALTEKILQEKYFLGFGEKVAYETCIKLCQINMNKKGNL